MFGELIVGYLFLGGAGAGGCLVTSVLGLLVEGDEMRALLASRCGGARGALFRRFFGGAWVASLGCLMLGSLCLAADLGRLDRLALILFAAPTNILVIGTWSLGLTAVLGVLSLAMWLAAGRLGGAASPHGAGHAAGRRDLRLCRAVQAATALAALVAATYTGLLLAGMASVPLWHSGWLPVLFVLSALSCGIALVVLAALATGTADPFSRTVGVLVSADRAVVLVEAACLAAWLGSVWAQAGGTEALAMPAHGTDAAALASVLSLAVGSRGALFWGGLVAVGLVLPLAVETAWLGLHSRERAQASRRPATARAALGAVGATAVLIGGFILRFLVVGAGLTPMTGWGF